MTTLAIWVAVFMLFGSCTVTPLGIKNVVQQLKNCLGCSIPLDMAPDSVDDMYDGCKDGMEKKIELLLNTEKSGTFKTAWDAAEKYYDPQMLKNSPLKKEEILAVHAYTLNKPQFYSEFNEAVRTQRSTYRTAFPYHAMHFYLTRALQSLSAKATECLKTYRGTNLKFQTAINSQIRFGAFTSSSKDTNIAFSFGIKSCFEIKTCFGADISKFSWREQEEEVLIPPYEVFKVTKIVETSKNDPLPCNVVYVLESAGKKSNLNCAFIDSGRFLE